MPTFNDDRKLAYWLLEMREHDRNWSSNQFFVNFGQLTGYDDRLIPDDSLEFFERGPETVRCLEEHDGLVHLS